VRRRRSEIWFAQTPEAAHFPFQAPQPQRPPQRSPRGLHGIPRCFPRLCSDPVQFRHEQACQGEQPLFVSVRLQSLAESQDFLTKQREMLLTGAVFPNSASRGKH
jgi:hypothetical protein